MRMALRVLPEPVVPAGAASTAVARDDVDRTPEG
jgi:hypothetical protein